MQVAADEDKQDERTEDIDPAAQRLADRLYLFRFDPAINLGCCGGARTSTASVAMVAEVAKSDVPMLGYTVPYAVSNTLLTLNGMIIVLMMR